MQVAGAAARAATGAAVRAAAGEAIDAQRCRTGRIVHGMPPSQWQGENQPTAVTRVYGAVLAPARTGWRENVPLESRGVREIAYLSLGIPLAWMPDEKWTRFSDREHDAVVTGP